MNPLKMSSILRKSIVSEEMRKFSTHFSARSGRLYNFLTYVCQKIIGMVETFIFRTEEMVRTLSLSCLLSEIGQC